MDTTANALSLLGLQFEETTNEAVEHAFRHKASENHPDTNPKGKEMVLLLLFLHLLLFSTTSYKKQKICFLK